jgi:hypothetical protein
VKIIIGLLAVNAIFMGIRAYADVQAMKDMPKYLEVISTLGNGCQ